MDNIIHTKTLNIINQYSIICNKNFISIYE